MSDRFRLSTGWPGPWEPLCSATSNFLNYLIARASQWRGRLRSNGYLSWRRVGHTHKSGKERKKGGQIDIPYVVSVIKWPTSDIDNFVYRPWIYDVYCSFWSSPLFWGINSIWRRKYKSLKTVGCQAKVCTTKVIEWLYSLSISFSSFSYFCLVIDWTACFDASSFDPCYLQ